MRKITAALLGATFLVSAVSAGQAADIYEGGGSLKDAPYVPAIGWTGFYVGGNLGMTLNDEPEWEYVYSSSEYDYGYGNGYRPEEALTAGIHIGYNWQTASNWVYGIEADYGIINDELDFGNEGTFGITDYIATIRGRLGIASGDSLLYTTAGIAFLGYDDEFSKALLGDAFDDTAVGLVVGAGYEHKLNDNLSIGVEGLYYDVSSDYKYEIPAGYDYTFDREFWNLRARLSYHFNRGDYEPLK